MYTAENSFRKNSKKNPSLKVFVPKFPNCIFSLFEKSETTSFKKSGTNLQETFLNLHLSFNSIH